MKWGRSEIRFALQHGNNAVGSLATGIFLFTRVANTHHVVRQAFAWGALPLFDAQGRLALHGQVQIESLFRLRNDMIDGDILQLIHEYKDPRVRKKQRTIAGNIALNIASRSYPYDLPVFDPQLQYVKQQDQVAPTPVWLVR